MKKRKAKVSPEKALALLSGIKPLWLIEKKAIERAIARLNGDRVLAAKLLQIAKSTLYKKLKAYALENARSRNAVRVPYPTKSPNRIRKRQKQRRFK